MSEPSCRRCRDRDAGPPAPPVDPPGRSALEARVRTHAGFLAAMLRDVERRPHLRRLTTRDADDPTVALLDAWAATLDVLTFYSERLLQEGFLRTATERRSVAELTRAIAYAPQPGVAAQAMLTFDLDTAAGAPERVAVPAGTKVASLPGPGERPQVFETVEELPARATWSRMAADRDEGAVPADGLCAVHVRPGVRVVPGDRLLLAHRTASGHHGFAVRTVADVEPLGDRVRVGWADPVEDGLPARASVGPAAPGVTVHLLTAARPFGHNAPDPSALTGEAVLRYGGVDDRDGDWAELTMSLAGWRGGRRVIGLDRLVVPPVVDRAVRRSGGFGEAVPARGFGSRVLHLDGDEHEVATGRFLVLTTGAEQQVFTVAAVTRASLSDFTLTRPVLRIGLDGSRDTFDDSVRATTVLLASAPLPLAPAPRVRPHEGREVPLAVPAPPPPAGRRVAVTGRRAQVVADRDVTFAVPGGPRVAVPAGTRLTALAFPRTTGRAERWSLQDAAGRRGVVTAGHGALRWSPSSDDAPRTAAVLAAAGAGTELDRTAVLVLTADLPAPVDPATLVLDANVALATHGEAAEEVLGSGRPEVAFQRLALGDGPVTHVRHGEGAGARSTLLVRVGGVVWDRVPTLHGCAGDARVHVAEQDDEDRWSVRFGDGTTGARPPGGAEISASYRVGLGRAGNVAAGALSQLRSRPLGVRGVTNPLPAEGGDDGEPLEAARRNAPLHVRTLDRVVSLRDHEDFAAAFAGVGRAAGRWLWDGRRRVVHLTCTGPQGGPLAGSTRTALLSALAAAADGLQPVVVQGQEDLRFVLAARLFADRRHRPGTVAADARAAVLARFAAPARDLARGTTAGDVARTLHEVPGIRGADLTELRLTTAPAATVAPVLPAAPARTEGGTLRPAQLLALADGEPPAFVVEVAPW